MCVRYMKEELVDLILMSEEFDIESIVKYVEDYISLEMFSAGMKKHPIVTVLNMEKTLKECDYLF